MKILVLDDSPERLEAFRGKHPDAICETTAPDCISQLEAMRFDVIYLDHDLGGEVFVDSSREDTGSEVARFLANGEHMQEKDVIIVCHSLNWSGRTNMIDILRKAGFTEVKDVPFTALRL